MEMNPLPTNSAIARIILAYRPGAEVSVMPKSDCSKKAYELLLNNWNRDTLALQEQFKVLLLNNANRAIGLYEASTGGSTQCIVDLRLIFACALGANAKKIILCHNHPSGCLSPSGADKSITNRIAEAGRILDIPVIDHLIITSEGYYSFADEGLL